MSRLIFTNLPPTLSSTQFRTHLSEPNSLSKSTITDLKLVPKRRFGFVGYKDEVEAQKVKDWFDGTFGFGGGKVKVEIVRDEPLAPKVQHRKSQPKQDEVTVEPVAGPSKRLQEFMEVMTSVEGSTPVASSSKVTQDGPVQLEKKGLYQKAKGKDKAVEEEPVAVAADGDDDAEWLRRRQKTALEDTELSGSTFSDPDESLILSTGRLFIRNLPFVTTSSDLETTFSPFGHLESVHLPVSTSTNEPLGTAFILYREPSHALEAYKKLDKTTFQGRLLHVLPGRARPGQESTGVQGIVDGKVLGKAAEGRGEVKGKVDTRRKEESAQGVNWASMYMNSDAVASSVASRMGISKSELLNGDDSNAAVKLALAETHVIEETKKYFEDAGIVLESLSPRVKRSQTTILVKNIPFGTTIHTLTDLFSPHGELKRVLLPASGTLGVVEFANSSEAGKAFKALNYRRLGNAVVYLEKGPEGMFVNPAQTDLTRLEDEKRALEEKIQLNETEVGLSRDAPEETDEIGSTLFLKNLDFSTTTHRLQSILSSLPGYSFARVQVKPDPKRVGEKLSMGYGFVGFHTRDAARKALGGLDGFQIDGKSLEVKFAQRGVGDGGEDKGKGKVNGKDGMTGRTKSTKLLVKNLAFEVTKKDVRELFSAYGTLKSLRLPKKSLPTSTGNASTRGFAFLEFTTHTEAARSMEALKHTHLLGRHLVIEWAREGDGVDLEGLRERTKGDLRGLREDRDGLGGGKRRKLDLTGGEGVGEEMDGLEG